MFFIVQIALPRNRVYCGFSNTDEGFVPVFNNVSSGYARMYEMQDDAQGEIDHNEFKGCTVAELIICE